MLGGGGDMGTTRTGLRTALQIETIPRHRITTVTHCSFIMDERNAVYCSSREPIANDQQVTCATTILLLLRVSTIFGTALSAANRYTHGFKS